MPPGLDPPEVIAVVGSVTPPGRLRRAVAEGLERRPVPGELLDLADLELPFADGSQPEGDAQRVIDRVGAARSVVLATPVYRGSLTGSLKNLLDLLPVEALEAKPVGLLAMGATPHHFLGAERHLRDVLSFFGAQVTPVAGYLTSRDFADGEPTEAAAQAVDALLADVDRLRGALTGAGAPALRPLATR